MLDYEAKALLGFTAHIIENVERSQKLIEEKIEEAAENYVNSIVNQRDTSDYSLDVKHENCRFDDYDIQSAFQVGANWALNNQWNNVDEILPKRKTTVFVILENGDDDICYFNEYDRFCAHINHSLKVKYWMTIPSLPEN